MRLETGIGIMCLLFWMMMMHLRSDIRHPALGWTGKFSLPSTSPVERKREELRGRRKLRSQNLPTCKVSYPNHSDSLFFGSHPKNLEIIDDLPPLSISRSMEGRKPYADSLLYISSCSQEYSRKLADEQILSQDTIHNLFLNLNSIVDFARRFLIGIEANACLPPDQQRFGSLFLLMVSLTLSSLTNVSYISLCPFTLRFTPFSSAGRIICSI